MQTVTLKVGGMTCSGCVASVKRVLEAVDGVGSAEVSLEQAQAVVRYDPAIADPASMRAAVEDAGFEAA